MLSRSFLMAGLFLTLVLAVLVAGADWLSQPTSTTRELLPSGYVAEQFAIYRIACPSASVLKQFDYDATLAVEVFAANDPGRHGRINQGALAEIVRAQMRNHKCELAN